MNKIKVGVFGCSVRGKSIAGNFDRQGCDIVAACDFTDDERKKAFLEVVGDGCKWYDSFDEFIKQDMDVVVLTNFAHEHASYAITCLEKGIHVFSECLSNGTMAEGVALIRAAEKSDAIYMLAENYPQMLFNIEMQRVCKGGTLGKILYAEGEYNHPGDYYDVSDVKRLTDSVNHWRNFLPRSYYITHSLGPLMKATGATPKKVNAFAAFAPLPSDAPTASHVGERAAVVTTLNDDDSIYKVTGCASYGGHHNSYRICGTEGQIENLRGMGGKVMLRYNEWSKPEGKEADNLYDPEWNDKDEAEIVKSGHGGADYVTVRMFLDCLRENRQPEHPFDVHSAVTMSSVAILAHRSVLENGKTFDIPDFHLEECRKQYENDTLTPFFGTDGSKPTLPCCSTDPNFEPSLTQVENFKKILK